LVKSGCKPGQVKIDGKCIPLKPAITIDNCRRVGGHISDGSCMVDIPRNPVGYDVDLGIVIDNQGFPISVKCSDCQDSDIDIDYDVFECMDCGKTWERKGALEYDRS